MMNDLKIKKGGSTLILNGSVKISYEKRVTPFGGPARLDVPKKYIGKRT